MGNLLIGARSRACQEEEPATVTPCTEAPLCLSEVTEKDLDEMVQRIRALPAHAHLEVGRMVVERLYGGLAAWQDRGPDDVSFQRLAARQGLSRGLSSVATLSRCVGLYELDRRMGGCFSRWKGLAVSHFRAVLNLLHHQQVELLDRAQAEGWTARELERQAARLRARPAEALPQSAGLSRRELAEAARLLEEVRRALADAEEWIRDGLDGARPEERRTPCTAVS